MHSPQHTAPEAVRHDWTVDEALALYELPFSELVYRAQGALRAHFDPQSIELATLLNVKTGGCPEDCAYCPQSIHHGQVEPSALMSLEEVEAAARRARDAGAKRFCMGAAWRQPTDRQIEQMAERIAAVRALGLETCATLGMLTRSQAQRLGEAGLDYYNHNLDTGPGFYRQIIHTREQSDRLETLSHVREAGLKVCCGGIIGMGESVRERCELLCALANLPEHPESVPINALVPVPGTPLGDRPPVAPLELARTIAVARLMMPRSRVRLSAGRGALTPAEQALCLLAGANSIFHGERLLTTPNPGPDQDAQLLDALGLRPEAPTQ